MFLLYDLERGNMLIFQGQTRTKIKGKISTGQRLTTFFQCKFFFEKISKN